jgi:hypothetical protein
MCASSVLRLIEGLGDLPVGVLYQFVTILLSVALFGTTVSESKTPKDTNNMFLQGKLISAALAL